MNRVLGIASLLACLSACGQKIDPYQVVDVGILEVKPAGVTWCGDIEPMMKRFCTRCHSSRVSGADRNGAPVGTDYDTYAQTYALASNIKAVIQNGSMPPGGRIPAVDAAVFVEWLDTGRKECGDSVSEEVSLDVPALDTWIEDTAIQYTCTSGTHWNSAREEGADMRPGSDCITCHATGERPFKAAATVMGGVHDEDDCNGIAGVVVAITEDGGVIRTKTTNSAGNFYWDLREAQFTLPYKARLSYEGRSREMNTAQNDLNCAKCHTARGLNGAPGRITVP